MPRPTTTEGLPTLTKMSLITPLENFNKAIQLQPDYVNAYYNRGTAYINKGEYNQAIKDFSKTIDLDFEHVVFAYRGRGVAYYAEDRFHRAIDDFSKVISLTPDDPFAYLGRGQAYRNLLVFEKAIQDFSTAIRLKPDEAADAYTERGVTYHCKGDIGQGDSRL